MGGSSHIKPTLLKNRMGLATPAQGEVKNDGVSFLKANPDEQKRNNTQCDLVKAIRSEAAQLFLLPHFAILNML